jgi:probable phosphoglycerate mutase
MLYLVRHGDTEWSPFRRLAGSRTDLDLTAAGETTAKRVGTLLAGVHFDRILCSPLRRARRTAELAGFTAEIDPRLRELDFGDYEGKTVHEIRETRPGYTYLVHGTPNGEDAAAVGARVDSVLAELTTGTTLIFAHSVLLRVMTARYLGLPPGNARNFFMAPGGIGILDFDPVDDAPVIKSWGVS